MTNGCKLKTVMADIVDGGLPQEPAPAVPARARVLLPLVECAHAAEPDEEMPPERAGAALQQEEAATSRRL